MYTNPAMFYYRKIQSDKINNILSEPKSGPLRINSMLFNIDGKFTSYITLERI